MDITLEKLSRVVDELKGCCDSIREKSASYEINYWQMFAYTHTLELIQENFEDEELKKLGLDFDVEERYMTGWEQN